MSRARKPTPAKIGLCFCAPTRGLSKLFNLTGKMSDQALETGMHKAIIELHDLPLDVRTRSLEWLRKRGLERTHQSTLPDTIDETPPPYHNHTRLRVYVCAAFFLGALLIASMVWPHAAGEVDQCLRRID